MHGIQLMQNCCVHFIVCVCMRACKLTLAELCLRYPLPDVAAGIVNHGGGLKLHGFHHIPHTDL